MKQASLDHIFSRVFTGDEFKRRRETMAKAIGPNASALLQGAPRRKTAHPEFSQNKIFFYVSGVEMERCYLLIDGANAASTLFVPDSDICNIPGGKLTPEGIAQIRSHLLIDEVLPFNALEQKLEAIHTLYVLHQPDEQAFTTKGGIVQSSRFRAADPWEQHRRRDEMLVLNLKKRFPRIELADLGPVTSKMRLIKSPAEIAVLRGAGELSAHVCIECMKATQPGIPLQTLEAISDYVYRLKGNCGHGYEIMLEPSHERADTLLDGDLVLLDCGPDYNYYTSDIARIWPINGHFDSWQRHTYGLITAYHKVLLSLAAPGCRHDEVYEEAAKRMLALYKDDPEGTAIVKNMIARNVRYYNHHVGLSVHDVVSATREDPLEEGMVLVVDPMVWLEDAPHGYVRVEDTIVITANGCERLTGSAPFEIEAIEALMKEPGRFPLELS